MEKLTKICQNNKPYGERVDKQRAQETEERQTKRSIRIQ